MFRFALYPLIILGIGIIISILGFYLFSGIKNFIKSIIAKANQVAVEQQNKWVQREQRKKLPDILQKAYIKQDAIMKSIKKLPAEWISSFEPLANQANDILHTISEYPTKADNIRSFFNHTLIALQQLVDKIHTDHAEMDEAQVSKVRENITVIKADMINHQTTLKKIKRFDFDVLMDVIKARLKR